MNPRTAPPLWALHILFLMTGAGTTLLGPLLPILMPAWGLRDAQAGLLLAAQFLGAFLGGVSVGSHTRRVLLTASAAAATGLLLLALASTRAHGMPFALAALLLAGFGIGHMIASNNILGGQFPLAQRARTLTLLNLSWSLGAILSPLLAAWLLPLVSLPALLAGFAALFALAGCAIFVRLSNPAPTPAALALGASRHALLFFGFLLLLYGGVETSMNGWLTTYILRYGDHTLRGSQLSASLFWISLIAGRLLTAAILRFLNERTLLRHALAASTVCIACLIVAHTPVTLLLCAILLGLSLAACFPVSFAIFMGYAPRARQAGFALALSGIGAALIPWLAGLLSSHTNSLHIGLTVPLLAAAVMLTLSLFLPASTASAFPDAGGV